MDIAAKKKAGYGIIIAAVVLFIVLGIIKAQVDKQSAYLCEITHETPSLNIQDCPAHESNISWLFVLSFGMVFVFAVIGFYFALNAPRQEQRTSQPVDLSKLDGEEKKVYTLLSAHEGSMYQSDLIRETGLSKVSITRVLDKMENRKIVERKRRGMANLVVLK